MSEFILKNKKKLYFRELRKGDEKALAAFNNELSKRSRALFMPHGYDDETISKLIQRVQSGEDAVFIALDEEKIAAYWFLWWINTPFPVLGIGILDNYHGLGLGGKLMHHLINLAEKQGCSTIELTTALDNKPARILYEKVGFKVAGKVENVSGDGKVAPEWHMIYNIKPGVIPPPRTHDSPI